MKSSISIFWFNQDLRISDNPGLIKAHELGSVLPIYILDDSSPSLFQTGAASKIYLHQSLISLNEALNNNLNFYVGNPAIIITQLIKKYKVENVFWNRCYEPGFVNKELEVKDKIKQLNVRYETFNGSYLWSPEAVKKDDGSYYKIFSAYKRKVYFTEPRSALPKPENLSLIKDISNETNLDHLKLTSPHPWQKKIIGNWEFGEAAAQNKLDYFVKNNLAGYKKYRDYPNHRQTSKLSVNLHFGEISPHQVWDSVNNIGGFYAPEADVNHFLSEMIWREFSCYLLTHFKELPSANFQIKFNDFPWKYDDKLFNAWKTGNTGYPLIDAGMRELWQTGYMHNRVRMVVASFLVKNLMIHWHYGRDWFWECLVDADLANNSASWQWVAGCGVDAAPYFRIFNPTIQGEKFDSEGKYTKKFVPELENLPNKYLFKPWQTPEPILKDAGIILGINYPKPIIDLTASRNRALADYKLLNSPMKLT